MDMLKYYSEQGIIPVHQNMPDSDFQNFKFQRMALYSNLGIQMSLLRGKSILEFGPGTGDNSRVLSEFHPEVLDLVDGNSSSRDSILKYIEDGKLPHHFTNFYFCDARNYSLTMRNKTDEVLENGYDLVVCEGIINGNTDPANFLESVQSLVRPGGMLVITLVSAWGVLDQALRRLYKPAVEAKFSSYNDQVECCSKIFSGHLRHLSTTKPIEDWVQDSILHPINENYIFSIPEALEVLGERYVAISSSPRFFTDFRWHKSLKFKSDKTNLHFLNEFDRIQPMLLDDRFQNVRDVELFTGVTDIDEVDKIVREIWNVSCQIWESNSYIRLPEIELLLDQMKEITRDTLPELYNSINEFMSALPKIANGNFDIDLPIFEKWWGRGLIYLSVRKI